MHTLYYVNMISNYMHLNVKDLWPMNMYVILQLYVYIELYVHIEDSVHIQCFFYRNGN